MRGLDLIRVDVRCAWRTLRRSPLFAAAAVLLLALGIGINVAVFTVVDATLFTGFRLIDGNDRILYVGAQKDGRGCCASYPDFEDWRAQARSFAGMGAVADIQVSFTDSTAAAEHYIGTRVSANAFALLGQRPSVGRDFVAADERPGAQPVAILSYRLWERRYGRDPAVVGYSVRINGSPTTVVGVMPRGFSFPQNQDLWLPLVPTPELQSRGARTLWFTFGRLADGATFESARAELATIGRRLAAAYPLTNDGWVPAPRTFAQFFVGVDAPAIYGALWGVVGFVLLIACANLANLLLTRVLLRAREFSVRIALGAPRWAVIRQLTVEGLMLSCAGGAIGWGVAVWGVRLYASVATPPTRTWAEGLIDYSMDAQVLLYTVALSVVTVVLCGAAPAVRLARLDMSAVLRDGGRGATAGKRGKRASSGLLVAQLALTLVLLSGAGVMMRSFVRLFASDIGVDTKQVLLAFLSLPPERYPDADRQTTFFDRLREGLQRLPEIEAVSLATSYPGAGAAQVSYEVGSAAPLDESRRPRALGIVIGPDYFRAVGVTLESGREFTNADSESPGASPPTRPDTPVIVNRDFAARHWPGSDAVGRRLVLYRGASPGEWSTVIGVAPNIVQDLTRRNEAPLVYTPYRGQPLDGIWVLARTRVPPATVAGALRREVQALDADLPVWQGPYGLADRIAGSGVFWSVRNNAVLLTVFALAALLIASTGVYATVAQSMSQRTPEIALRLAIGASRRDILRLTLRDGVLPLGIGLAGGLLGSVAVNRLFETQLVRVSPTDPLTLVVTSAVLLGCAALGYLIPARRAMRVDPIAALKRD